MSITFAILGFQLEKVDILQKVAFHLQKSLKKSLLRQPIWYILTPQRGINSTHKSQDSDFPSECKFYIGYLQNRPKSVEIPEGCLECEHVANCLSPVARTLERGFNSS